MSTPFKNIALAFSGGGFRAAGFSLGTVSYFEHIGLLKEVSAISSVSGGSITAVKYAQSLIDDESFDTFFKSYYSFLKDDQLANDALKDLNKKSVWDQEENKHKTENSINAFAIQYNTFTKQKTFGDFHKYAIKKDSKLKKLIINATDFSEAIQFRMKNISGSEKFGNGKIDGSYRQNWQNVKLGDALAASSAFPGGFEPILFPNDFYGEKENKEYLSLMDGGIVDNQGASSLLPHDIKDNSKYGLYFVSDVASPYVDEPLKAIKIKWFSKVITYLFDFVALLVVLLGTLIFYALKHLIGFWSFACLTVIIVFFQIGMLVVSRKINSITGIKNKFRLPTKELGTYIVNRVTSLVYMMSIVMLKNNRRSNANNLYNRFRKQAITSTIYELRCRKKKGEDESSGTKPENASSWEDIKIHTKEISPKIISMAETAASFGTTLWFKDKTILDKLVACGEFTACYNLIAFMVEQEETYPRTDAVRKALFKTLLADWKKFQEDPDFLIKKRKLAFK